VTEKRIIIALDFPTADIAELFLSKLDPASCRVKIGKELFTAAGPDFVRRVVEKGFDVFLDLKFHDIPNTVARAVRASAKLGVWMINVHASGGVTMMSEARAALEEFPSNRPLLIAVTVLTSLNESELTRQNVYCSPAEQVDRLAELTFEAGLDGVVCSAAEAPLLRGKLGDDFILVTPGIRRTQDAKSDQKRVVGPTEAVAMGSTYLVIGRPVTRAVSPVHALEELNSAVARAQ